MAGKIFIASAFAAFFRKKSHNIPSANEWLLCLIWIY